MSTESLFTTLGRRPPADPAAHRAPGEANAGSQGAAAADFVRQVSDSLPCGVLVAAPDGTILIANQRIEQLFGYSREELIGASVDLLVPEDLRARHAAHHDRFFAAPDARPMGRGRDLTGRRRDGSTFAVEIGLTSIEATHGELVVATVADIAVRGEAERAHWAVVESQLELERLVAKLLIQFINLPPAQVDVAIRDALERIGEALDLDRCTLYHITPDSQLVELIRWERSGLPAQQAPVPAAERFPWVIETLRAAGLVGFSSLDEIPNSIDLANYRARGTQSAFTVGLQVAGQLAGAVGFEMVGHEQSWAPETAHRLQVLAVAFGNVLWRRKSDEALAGALGQVQSLSDQLRAENLYLRREVQERIGVGPIEGQSAAIAHVLEQAKRVAATDATVLLLGETGTGKEILATQIHELSSRRARAMVRVNCSAIPETLIESELFGREKGAYTGALAKQIGRFELADRSTIFLDEIGELPADVQVKLLRVLEERQIERLGSPRSIRIDTRIIAATHRDLEERIVAGAFREDLFYRLNVFPIRVPPLRERVEDIPLLIWRFVEEFSRAFGRRIETISRENMSALQRYGWPGNIRELRNVVERAMIIASGPRLTIPLPASVSVAAKRSVRLVEVEKEHIKSILESTGWRIRGTGGAAERLGLRPTTLETRMAKLGLKRPKSP
jgi:formate hydrogenlyase transcriptional activator